MLVPSCYVYRVEAKGIRGGGERRVEDPHPGQRDQAGVRDRKNPAVARFRNYDSRPDRVSYRDVNENLLYSRDWKPPTLMRRKRSTRGKSLS